MKFKVFFYSLKAVGILISISLQTPNVELSGRKGPTKKPNYP